MTKIRRSLTQSFVDEGVSPLDIINKGLIQGMDVVGARFKSGEMFIPEVLLAAQAMNAGMEIVRPLIVSGDLPNLGTIVIGTVAGDLHDIGKNLVAMMMESAGFKVIDLGSDVATEDFIKTAKENNAQIIGMSALLTTTMINMKEVIDSAKEAGVGAKCIVGGAPVNQEFANEIGADGYAPDGAAAVELCKELLA